MGARAGPHAPRDPLSEQDQGVVDCDDLEVDDPEHREAPEQRCQDDRDTAFHRDPLPDDEKSRDGTRESTSDARRERRPDGEFVARPDPRPRALRPNLRRLRTMDDPPARSRPRLAKSGVLFSAHADARPGPPSVTASARDPPPPTQAYFGAADQD